MLQKIKNIIVIVILDIILIWIHIHEFINKHKH